MVRKRTNKDSGVVMMETLIMLPVYFVILAGVFWLGEMCLIRQTLNTAERLRLWESGNRQSNFTQITDSNIFKAFIANSLGTEDRQLLVTGVSGDDSKDYKDDFSPTETTKTDWGTVKRGFVQLNTRRSEWSWGIVDFAKSNLWNGWGANATESKTVSGQGELGMVSRGNSAGQPLESVMCFRMDTGYRSGFTSFATTVWNDIYAKRWEFFSEEMLPAQCADDGTTAASYLAPYNPNHNHDGKRHSLFTGWSL